MEFTLGSNSKAPGALQVADWIRDRIRRGRMVPGQRLVEVEIIRQTGASRAKVREAFQRLEVEGLVEIEEYRGASVRDAGIDEVRQIYHCRAALEGLCAAEFIANASDDQREELMEIQRQLDECVEKHIPEQFGRLNLAWHRKLIEGAGNEVAASLLERLHVPIHRLMFESFYSTDRLSAANADHHRVIAAIKANDPVRANAEMQAHISAGLGVLSMLHEEVLA
ncbi:GntR family transcriptional regulator [Sphingopyxis indica]|nr:GntR family transcriptional regulator [Sphingopyxis indica]